VAKTRPKIDMTQPSSRCHAAFGSLAETASGEPFK
jgi:hypothetical protein